MTKHIVVLFSGGLDSVIMAKMAEDTGAKVTKVYFDIGHDYAWKEKQALPEDVIVHDLSWYSATGHSKDGNAMSSIFIPGRNLLFATMAACKYLPDEIWLGALCGEIHQHATDKNEIFRRDANDLFSYVLGPFGQVKIIYPFVEREMGKLEATKWAIEHGMTDEVINSSSCMSGEEGKCGTCGVCLRRAGIFLQLGLVEHYNTNPWESLENRQLIYEILRAELDNDDSHYDKYRRDELVPALRALFPELSLEEICERYKI